MMAAAILAPSGAAALYTSRTRPLSRSILVQEQRGTIKKKKKAAELEVVPFLNRGRGRRGISPPTTQEINSAFLQNLQREADDNDKKIKKKSTDEPMSASSLPCAVSDDWGSSGEKGDEDDHSHTHSHTDTDDTDSESEQKMKEKDEAEAEKRLKHWSDSTKEEHSENNGPTIKMEKELESNYKPEQTSPSRGAGPGAVWTMRRKAMILAEPLPAGIARAAWRHR